MGSTGSARGTDSPAAAGGGDVLLETADLTKRFGALTANDRISFSVTEGEIRGLIGPNGSGKSTFFNTVTGFYRPNRGRVTFDGEDITGWKPHRIARRGLARTFQITHPFGEMTVRANLLAVPTAGSVEERRRRATEILDFLKIGHLAEDRAREMSGGQQKLLELARILMLEPQCILLDEPTAGVNPALEARILDRIEAMNREGTTFVVVEHDMDVIRTIADTVTVFDQGKIIEEGTFTEVKDSLEVREAYLGGGGDGVADASDSSASSGTGVPSTAVPKASDETARRPERRLIAEDVVTGYGQHEVVHGISVESRDGVTCVFGPNGSGKSTLLKAMNGMVPVWSGSVRYGDRDLTDRSANEILRTGIATLPQEGGVFGTLSVEDNLKVGALNVLDDREAVNANMDEVLSEFPVLEEKLDQRADSLSGGQQMMLSFGRSMMTDAEVYLLDEPTAGLAPSLVDDVFDLVEILVDRGSQVVLVEQNVRAALGIADYVYILAQGDLQFEGTPDELSDEDELIDLYLGI